jgi:hypothetical protein
VFQALAHLGSMRVGGEQREIASLLMAIIDGLMIQHLLDTERTPSADALLAAVERRLVEP